MLAVSEWGDPDGIGLVAMHGTPGGRIATKPWGFDVESIQIPVYLTYGRADTLVPAAHGDWLAAHIPGAKVVATDAGHMGDDSTVEGQFAWLAGA